MPGRRVCAVTAFSAAMLIGAAQAGAAPAAENPDWPCQQRLVPKLAAASYWNGPPLEGPRDWHADPGVANLVRQLAPRRVSTAEGLTAIAAFARSVSGDRRRRLSLLFIGLLDESNRERADLIDRLEQLGRRQRKLADLVAHLGAALSAIAPGATGDAGAKRLELQQLYDFSARNFEEIQRTMRYACEAPAALDARLGAWARALQSAAAR